MRKAGLFVMVVLSLLGAGRSWARQAGVDLAGSWRGYEHGDDVVMRLEIAATPSGGWRAVVWRDAGGLSLLSSTAAATQVSLTGAQVDIAVEPLKLTYHGAMSADGQVIAGRLSEGSKGDTELELHRVKARRDVDVGQLRGVLGDCRGKAVGEIAKELSGLRLTERLGEPVRAEEETSLPGAKSKEALRILAEESAFMDPPAEETATLAKPELAKQREMVNRAVDYVVKTVHRMPNFLATRVTTTYRRDLWRGSGVEKVRRVAGRVVYRDGKEESRAEQAPNSRSGLTTSGEFGPILSTLIVDAAKGHLLWSHWEAREKPLAVFRYAVDAEHSHYWVDGTPTGYTGEFAVDPSSGAIRRLVFKADAPADDKLLVAEIAVEYGPVQMGGGEYMCPLRGVALSEGLQQTLLNEVAFEGYHVFHATVRIVPE